MGTRGWFLVGLVLTLFLGLTTDQILNNVYDSVNTALRANVVVGGGGNTPTPRSTDTPAPTATPIPAVATATPAPTATPQTLTSKSALHSGWTGAIAASNSYYIGFGGGNSIGAPNTSNGSAPDTVAPIPTAGTLKNLYCRLSNNLSGGTLTVSAGDRLPGGDINATTLTCQVASGAHVCQDTTHSVSVTTGTGASTNSFTLKLVTDGSFAIGGNGGECGVEYDPT